LTFGTKKVEEVEEEVVAEPAVEAPVADEAATETTDAE